MYPGIGLALAADQLSLFAVFSSTPEKANSSKAKDSDSDDNDEQDDDDGSTKKKTSAKRRTRKAD